MSTCKGETPYCLDDGAIEKLRLDLQHYIGNMNKHALYSQQVNAEFPTNATQSGSAVSAWVAIYAQIPATIPSGYTAEDLDWVYFRGRMFREINIGTGS